MTDNDLIDMLRTKQICTGFKPDGHGDVNVVYGPDPVTAEAADRIDALTAERDRLRGALLCGRRLWAIAQDDRVRLLIQLEQCEKRHEG